MAQISRRKLVGAAAAGLATLAVASSAAAEPVITPPGDGSKQNQKGLNPIVVPPGSAVPQEKMPNNVLIVPPGDGIGYPVKATVPAATEPVTWMVMAGVESPDMAVMGMGFYPKNIFVNAGDTVTWTVQSSEFHTITFLKAGDSEPAFDPTDPTQATPQGGSTYDGHSYYNSGLLVSGKTYSLTFDMPGDFKYYCLVHPPMKGVVHVRPAGTPYPFGQAHYNWMAQNAMNEDIRHGLAVWEEAARYTTSGVLPLVVAGAGDGDVAVMRFIPGKLTVKVGDTVTFTNLDSATPHTIVFGKEPAAGQDFAPIPGRPPGPQTAPVSYDGTGTVNSGYIGYDWPWGTTFRITFTKAGTYKYICSLHDDMGMTGEIDVV